MAKLKAVKWFIIGVMGAALVILCQGYVFAQQVDMDAIFWCKPPSDQVQSEDTAASTGQSLDECTEARSLILTNCTVCHTFVPIVLQQFDDDAWKGLIDRHRPRVSHLEEGEIQLILAFLREHFNPENPPPELPVELLDNWTAY